ncbi:protein quiver isoform X2 [Teleopsis dalmanni]|uniref:protein quiver isoform X2 n=1 Tax=Teleopsis dalmanni TaxID=139649 RepID=UPI0018CE7F07|nr:protein quiver isoform X2 [Teleopsis dalmanni]
MPVMENVQFQGLLRRCYQCRSRGELGSCKDPFSFNATDVENEPGLSAIPCASGWCGKVIEGGGTYAVDDYDQAIQRMCVQRGPNDNQDRCANTIYNYKKVYMCFCQGDLCNSSNNLQNTKNIINISIVLVVIQTIFNFNF